MLVPKAFPRSTARSGGSGDRRGGGGGEAGSSGQGVSSCSTARSSGSGDKRGSGGVDAGSSGHGVSSCSTARSGGSGDRKGGGGGGSREMNCVSRRRPRRLILAAKTFPLAARPILADLATGGAVELV